MTTPYSLAPLFRHLARWSPLRPGLAYVGCIAISVILLQLAGHSRRDVLMWAGIGLWMGPLAILYCVVTWYRTDDAEEAALLLVGIAYVGAVAFLVATLIVDREPTMWLLLPFTTVLGTILGAIASVIGFVVWVFIAKTSISLGRRLRRFFAPATKNDSRHGF